ncbi:hypothetical protein L1987_29394 [Smallanthus sonchifolius]|uniref:Uncharacterized protein n=1 Tax=Smallanthus sonchifolius TaxID=185202 RepID=A0ACB9I1N8_9ASTR|nr:hypothetical protein L1987_29394 [Smallanthus sonchifolius]
MGVIKFHSLFEWIFISNHPIIIQEDSRAFKEHLGYREVQHRGHEEEHDERPQGMGKRGLRTSWTVHFVHGNFDLPIECVNYILVRDKYRQRLSKFVGKWLTKIDTRSCLSVYNRLEGWRVETRKRPDKTHDRVRSLD